MKGPWTPEKARDEVWQDGDKCEECPHRHSWVERYEYWGSMVSERLSECRGEPEQCPGVIESAEAELEDLEPWESEELFRRNLNDDLVLPWFTQFAARDPVEAESIINAALFLQKQELR